MLNDLCAPGVKLDLASHPPIELLVVDDDLIARRAMVGALQTTFKRPENVESGEAALALAAEKTFDVIFLDVVMPGMDGYATCAKIRGTIVNRTTPVVFVTGQQDDVAREQMKRAGGNDLVGKAVPEGRRSKVKALTYVLRGKDCKGGAGAPAACGPRRKRRSNSQMSRSKQRAGQGWREAILTPRKHSCIWL